MRKEMEEKDTGVCLDGWTEPDAPAGKRSGRGLFARLRAARSPFSPAVFAVVPSSARARRAFSARWARMRWARASLSRGRGR